MSYISDIKSYLKAHIVPTKSASSSDAKTVASLRFMAITLLIIGLATSWLGIAPFAFTMLVKFMPDPLAYIICILICGLISMLVDFPLGVFVPNIFAKMFEPKKTALVWAKIAALWSLAGMLSYLTMTLSSSGGEMTTKQLFENDRPKAHAIGTIALDSTLQARGQQIRTAAKDELKTAEAKDKAIKAEANKLMQVAKFTAAKKYENWKLQPYHRKGYNAIVDKARIDSANIAAGARNLQEENERMNITLASTNAAFLEEIDGKKKALDVEWAEYNHKTKVANLFLSYLGWVATPLFWLICLLTVLMGLKEGGAPEPEEVAEEPEKKKVIEEVIEEVVIEVVDSTAVAKNKAENSSFSEITSQVTTELDRLIKYIASKDSDTHTPANNLVKMYNLAKTKDINRFNAMIARLKTKYSDMCLYETILKYC